MTIYYLALEDIKKINRKIVSSSEACFSYQGGIEFILSNVKNLYENLPEKDAIVAKASYLWHGIASNQYLINGNKRTGYVVAEVFLRLNKLNLMTTEDDKFFISKAIANDVYTIDRVRLWITKSLKSE